MHPRKNDESKDALLMMDLLLFDGPNDNSFDEETL